MSINRIDIIPVRMPEKEIMMRLGFNRHHTVINGTQEKQIRELMSAAFARCRPRGCWRRLDITSNDGARIELAGGELLASAALSKLLHDSQAVWVAAVSVGQDISDTAAELAATGNGAAAASPRTTRKAALSQGFGPWCAPRVRKGNSLCNISPCWRWRRSSF